MAAGIDASRGDAVSVQPLSQLDDRLEPEAAVEAVPQRIPSSAPSQKSAAGSDPPWIVGGLVAAVILIAALAIIQTMRRRPLSPEQRQRMLEDIQRALTDENVAGSRARYERATRSVANAASADGRGPQLDRRASACGAEDALARLAKRCGACTARCRSSARPTDANVGPYMEIGRASCRERV